MDDASRGHGGASPVHGVGFGAELRRRREAAGLSQPALGRLANYDRILISTVETGAELPSAAFAEAVDRALEAGGPLVALAPLPEPDDLTTLKAAGIAGTFRQWWHSPCPTPRRALGRRPAYHDE